MCNKLLLTAIIFIYSHLTTAQVLYFENFDNFTVGNVSTDPTGQTPGQGNWYTVYDSSPSSATPNWFQIKNEPNKGKVMTLESPAPPVFGNTALQQRNIDQLINSRTLGNDVIKFEVDFYTGAQQHTNSPNQLIVFGLYADKSAISPISTLIATFTFTLTTGEFYGGCNSGRPSMVSYQYYPLGLNGQRLILPFNTWVKCIFYADYSNKVIYFELPELNIIVQGDFLDDDLNANRFNKFSPNAITIFSYNKQVSSINKFDNIKITALNNVPLSVSEFLNKKFNIFPNPATNVLNITNTDNIIVEQLAIYDINGKKIKEEKFNNKTNINIEGLQSGTYLLHLKTNLGIAVKKFIKM